MQVPLSYGKQDLRVNIPESCQATVIQKPPMPLIRNLEKTIHSKLSDGVGSPTLRELAERCKSVCILVCDITRPVPNHALLPPILKILFDAGVERQHVRVLIATGLHRPNLGEELKTVVGDDPILASVKIENHYAQDDQSHVDLGHTLNDTPIKIDRRFLKADLKLVIGLIEPHFMAGFSGGRKLIVPGIAHEDTIRTLHNSKFMGNPNCKVCKVDGNPLHGELIAITERLRQHCRTSIFGVNVVVDADRRLSFVNFGELEVSHEQAMAFCRAVSVVNLDRQFPIVLSTAAGYPLDQTFYQAIKGIVTPLDIVEPNGTLILVAECKEGLGSQSFQRAQLQLCQEGADSFLQSLTDKPRADIDEWSTQLLARAKQRTHIMLYSDKLSKAQHALTGTQRISSIDQGLKRAFHKHASREIAVIPEGPYVVPRFCS